MELVELGTICMPSGTIQSTLYFTNNIALQNKQVLDWDEHIEIVETTIEEAFEKIGSNEWKDPRLGIELVLARSRGLIY